MISGKYDSALSKFVSYILFAMFYVSLNMGNKYRAEHDRLDIAKGPIHRKCRAVIAPVILIAVTALTLSCSAHAQTPPVAQVDNTSPVIRYLTANELTSTNQVMPSTGLEISCTATDADNDTLHYTWNASGGTIKGEDELILWISPDDEGQYTVTVTVDDGKGGSASSSVTLRVTATPSAPPVVSAMHCINCENAIEASRWTTYEIMCDAFDPENSPLQYTWFASTGKIEGDGPSATWITQGQYGNALITVIVTDVDGNEGKGYLAVNISCCH